MGQTLTHGIYLPDEGERNCYNGLAGNWQLLDGAVGTVAEHTTQIAGKAPLVHTHTKADITDFPAYGTTAGTICEGNDSRLSDARTPVAHTHLTSDVTDLLNSAHTWTGENTYSKTVAIERNTDTGNFLALKNTVAELGSTPASATPVTIAYRDKNDENLGYMGIYYDTDGSNHFRLYIRNKFTSGAPSTTGSYDYAFFGLRLNADKSKEGILKASFRPYDNNAHDLGSSSYQWNNLYAKNYYYNGTAWGLDKDNTWSKCQNFAGEYQGTEASNKYHTVFAIYSKYDTLGKSGMLFTKWRENKAQGALTSSDLVQIGIDVLENEVRTNHVFNIQAGVFDSETGLCNTCNVISRMANANLGTSSYKWKTLNGINPGALSLPNSPGGTGTENVNYYDLSGNITVRDGSATNNFTAACDGWIAIGTFATWLQISNDTLILATTANPGTDGFAQAFLPVRKGNYIRVIVNQTNTQFQSFKLLPCEGNV